MPQPWNEVAQNPPAAEALLADIRARGYATMHAEFSRLEYGRQISTVGVPILVDGRSVAAMNVLYLKSALSEDEAVAAMLAPLQDCAAAVATALAADPG